MPSVSQYIQLSCSAEIVSTMDLIDQTELPYQLYDLLRLVSLHRQ
jgi:hypothetical protein